MGRIIGWTLCYTLILSGLFAGLGELCHHPLAGAIFGLYVGVIIGFGLYFNRDLDATVYPGDEVDAVRHGLIGPGNHGVARLFTYGFVPKVIRVIAKIACHVCLKEFKVRKSCFTGGSLQSFPTHCPVCQNQIDLMFASSHVNNFYLVASARTADADSPPAKVRIQSVRVLTLGWWTWSWIPVVLGLQLVAPLVAIAITRANIEWLTFGITWGAIAGLLAIIGIVFSLTILARKDYFDYPRREGSLLPL